MKLHRVNRYQKQFSLEDKLAKWKYEDSKLDFIEVAVLYLKKKWNQIPHQELLMRNMDHCAEHIVSYLNFEVIFST